MIYYPDFVTFSAAELTTVELCEEYEYRCDLKPLASEVKKFATRLEEYEDFYARFDPIFGKDIHDEVVNLKRMIEFMAKLDSYYKREITSRRLELEAQEFNRFSDDQHA